MTYTVKNGTWCKDNEGEYFSTTEQGMRAAYARNELPVGTRVVLHERRHEAGEIIQSLSPNPPEGFLRPDGSPIESYYTDLIAVIGPNLPDLRECVLVCAGENEDLDIAEHDIYLAGQFKDDQSQTHVHGRGTMNITGSISQVQSERGKSDNYPTGAFTVNNYKGNSDKGSGHDRAFNMYFNAARSWTGQTSSPIASAMHYVEATPISNPSAEGLYERDVTYIMSTDTIYDTSKTYYTTVDSPVTDPYVGIDPSVNGWYEFDEATSTFSPTTDTEVALDKEYYSDELESSAIDINTYVNPSSNGWLEAQFGDYKLTTDATIMPGKQYYKQEKASADARIGNTTHGKQYGVYFYIAF